jgi:hypothetical protein
MNFQMHGLNFFQNWYPLPTAQNVLYFLVHKYVQAANNGVKLTREFQHKIGSRGLREAFERKPGAGIYHLDGPIYRRTAEEKKLNEIVREDVFRSAGLWAGIGPGNRK